MDETDGALATDRAPTAPHPGDGPPRRTRWWIELLVAAWLYWLYDAVNDLAPVRQQRAVRHGAAVVGLERRLHVEIEWTLDRWTAHHRWIGIAFADFYDTAHVWVAAAALVWLWWRRPAMYPRLRNVLVGVNVVGFAVFWLYPVAPPRMLPGFVDVVTQQHAWFSWHSGTLATAANQLAAMPSLHVAWAVWVAVAVWQGTTSPRWRTAGVVHVAVTVVAVMATGNHYALDVVAGAATLGLSATAVAALPRVLRRGATP